MFPILLSVNSFTIYTLAVFTGVGFFLASFMIWRRLRDLGLEEKKIIDFLLLFYLIGFVFARIGFILTHFRSFGFSPVRWLLVGRYSGFSFWSAALGSGLAMIIFIRRQRWDFWRVADELIFGLLPLIVLIQVGAFFDGTVLGQPTGLPWGMYFPGDFIRRQPVSLFGAVLFFFLWLFLLQIERYWRTWEWYKSKAEGFMALTFLGLSFLVTFLLAFLEEDGLYFLLFKKITLALGFLIILIVFLKRSGAKLLKERKK